MRKIKRSSISRNKKAYLFLAPSLTGVTVFVLIPFGDVVLRSFQQAVGGRFVGFQNYIEVLNNQAFRLALKNTARFLGVCIPLLLLISLGTALLVHNAPNSGLYKTSILLPMAIPVASIVLLWKIVFFKTGLLSQWAVQAGFQARDWIQGDSAFGVLVFTYLWKNTGYDMVLWLAGLDGIAKEYYEAAEVDGAGEWQKFLYITMPELKSTVFLAAVLSVVNSFKVFREAYLIAGDYPHESIYMLQHLFNNWFLSLDLQKMSAASVLLLFAAVILAVLWSGKRRAGE